jgi:tetratricopeptide (TPR) repeat protein
LEGSVRRDAKSVRINVQLVQTRDHSHLWAHQYDRELSSLLAVQGEIAQAVANEISLTLAAHKSRFPLLYSALSPADYEAYNLYLKGRYFWNKRSEEGFQQAIQYFEQAVAKDPSQARAYAGLADSYALISSYSVGRARELMPKAQAAALRALELDEGLAEAHTSLALILLNYEFDWKGAEKEYRRAIELDPNYATAHHWYAEMLAFQGRFEEALTESERARQLDPLSLIIATDSAAIFYYSRQYDRAIGQFRLVLAAEPSFPRAHMVAFPYVEKGDFDQALAGVRKWRLTDTTPWTWAVEAYIEGRAGRIANAQHAIEKLQEATRRSRLNPAPMLALAYAGMNDKEKAVEWLDRAYLEHCNSLTALKVDPAYDSLRTHPQFQELMLKLGFAEPQSHTQARVNQ